MGTSTLIFEKTDPIIGGFNKVIPAFLRHNNTTVPVILRIPSDKCDIDEYMSGLATQHFLFMQSRLPVAKLFGVFGNIAIMERLPGETLEKSWPRMSTQQRRVVIGQLAELQVLLTKHTFTHIGCICWKDRKSGQLGLGPMKGYNGTKHGPFKTFSGLARSIMRSVFEKCGRKAKPVRGGADTKCRTYILHHVDFEPRNIMVDGTEVVGLLDWDGAQILPEPVAVHYPAWLIDHYGMSSVEEEAAKQLTEHYETTLKHLGREDLVEQLQKAYDGECPFQGAWGKLTLLDSMSLEELVDFNLI